MQWTNYNDGHSYTYKGIQRYWHRCNIEYIYIYIIQKPKKSKPLCIIVYSLLAIVIFILCGCIK